MAVIGAQSAGKSSVLEMLTRRDLFPRGDDIVTRCPIVLETEYDGTSDKESVFFNGEPTTLDSLVGKIQKAAESIPAGSVDDKPITIRIRSKNVVTTAMVDLPGLTKVHVDGQDPNIVDKIRAMVKNFIADTNCIILAVTPATSDIANSEALELALEVDPERKRTLGVLTKIDAMEAGKNAANVLNGSKYPLVYGWVGVVNRNQLDVDKGMTIEESQEKEEQFFASRECYSTLEGKCGSKYLAKRIQDIHESCIRACLPDIKRGIESLLDKASKEVKTFEGFDEGHTPEMKLAAITAAIDSFNDNFQAYVRGDWQFQGSQISRIVQSRTILRSDLKAAIASIDADGGLELTHIQRVVNSDRCDTVGCSEINSLAHLFVCRFRSRRRAST